MFLYDFCPVYINHFEYFFTHYIDKTLKSAEEHKDLATAVLVVSCDLESKPRLMLRV